MEVGYVLVLHYLVIKEDIPRLDSPLRKQIRDVVRARLTTNPEVFGKPLQQDLRGCRRLRVGDYRVVFQIKRKEVHILAIVHRSSNYKDIKKRI